MAIYLCSDWHFCHNRDFIYKPRGFNSVEEMNTAIINRHNTIVKSNDDVYCLGDLCLNNDEKGLECISKLNGNLHIICGNHDTNKRRTRYKLELPNVFEVCDAKTLRYNNQSIYLSHYPTITSNFDGDKPLRYRVINICGHTHTKDKFSDMDKGIIYHVDMDAHNCTPVSIDKILNDIAVEYMLKKGK
jgi:calcineurin-like phosphoesterase family protein